MRLLVLGCSRRWAREGKRKVLGNSDYLSKSFCELLLSLPLRGAWIEINGTVCCKGICESRSPCGERGLKFEWVTLHIVGNGRSPCGERGLKYHFSASAARPLCRSPCGERGLKFKRFSAFAFHACRSPCGERGLKFDFLQLFQHVRMSLPLRGAWIEIWVDPDKRTARVSRSPCGERGLK